MSGFIWKPKIPAIKNSPSPKSSQVFCPREHLQSKVEKKEVKQRKAFYFDRQKKLSKKKAKNIRNNSKSFAGSASSQSSLKSLKECSQYLGKVKNFLKRDFPADITSLISEYFSDQVSISQLLRYVVEGEQDKAEILVEIHPELLLKRGTVMDLSRREFKNITAFQYAVWALDWHMWKMLLKYLSKKAATLQCADLEEKGTAHGKHFNLEPLIDALNRYVENYDAWHKVEDWGKFEQHWFKVVGGNQLLLPVHIINEYCHPTRSFYPCPKFGEDTLSRSRKCDAGEWFTCEFNGGKLGDGFGIFRYDKKEAAYDGLGRLYVAIGDAEALRSLWQMHHLQLEELRSELSVYALPRFISDSLLKTRSEI